MKFGVGILGNQPVREIVRQVQLAESLGYETAWIADTQLVCRELYVTMTSCVQNTSRIKIASGVTVAYTRHPSVTASAMVSLNELAEGRIVMGVGTGDSALGTLGIEWRKAARVESLEKLVETVRDLMANRAVEFENGTEGRIVWLDRPHHIPIYVAGSGPRMLEAAGRLGDGVVMYSTVSPSILSAGLGYIAKGAKAIGRQLNDLAICIWAPTAVSRDGRLARDNIRGRVASHLRHPLPIQLPEEDMAVVETIRKHYDFLQHATAGAKHYALVPDRFIDLMALAGTPEEVRGKVNAIAGIPEIGQIIVLPEVSSGTSIPREDVFRLFAEEVMAHVM
jgi:5,10-methylenetetrahydromethanopterin reductase